MEQPSTIDSAEHELLSSQESAGRPRHDDESAQGQAASEAVA